MKGIATKMNLSNQTIDTYARNLYRKFGVNGRIGLICSVLIETKGVPPLDSSQRS